MSDPLERFLAEMERGIGASHWVLCAALAELCRRATERTEPRKDETYVDWLERLDYAEKGRDSDGDAILDTTKLSEQDFRAVVMGMLDASMYALRSIDVHVSEHCRIMDAWKARDEAYMRLLSRLKRGEIDVDHIEIWMADNLAKWEEHRDG